MKRYLAMIPICLALAIGILCAGNAALNRTESKEEQTILISRGDASELTGLTVKTAISYEYRLLWETTRNMGTGETDTAFSFEGAGITPEYGNHEAAPYEVYTRLCNTTDADDPVCRELEDGYAEGSAGEINGIFRTLQLRDYYDTYSLYFGQSYMYTNQMYETIPATAEGWSDGENAFPLLQIPVEETDLAEVYYGQAGRDVESRNAEVEFVRFAHPYQSFAAACADGMLVTVGFTPDADPKAEWAPAGFGIWMLPKAMVTRELENGGTLEEQIFDCGQARLVYSLDIETQNVLAFQWSADEAALFLITAEQGEAVLRILDGETFDLLDTVRLGAVGISEEEVTFSGNFGNYTVQQVRFDPVRVHGATDFTVIAVGERLTVLQPAGRKWVPDYSCDVVSLCRFYDADDRKRYIWQDDPAAEEIRYADGESPVSGKYLVDFSDMAMCYRDHRLAMAWYGYDDSLHLHVYGPDGIIYAECSTSTLQEDGNRSGYQSFNRVNYLPKLSWQEGL